MEDSAYRFAFVSNSLPVAKAAQAFAITRGVTMDIQLASMEEAIPVATRLLEKGINIIIGGGGTGKLLRRHLNQPVVTIERNHLDLLQSLLKAKSISDFIAVTCYGTIPEGFELFADLLKIKLFPILFTTTQELIDGISKAIEAGVGCLVGDGLSAQLANARGCKGIVVMPGHETLERAFDESLNIARYLKIENEHNTWLNGMLNVLHEGVIGVDGNGKVISSNPAAQSIIPALSKNSDALLDSLGLNQTIQTGKSTLGQIQMIDNKELVINTSPVKIDEKIHGGVAAFMPASKLQDLTSRIEKKQDNKFRAKYYLSDLVGNTPRIQELRKQAKLFAVSDAAIHIHGESGTGKEILAHAIHNASNRNENPFVAINCGSLPESLLESEIFGYEEGAFTGAKKGGKPGLFELAKNGTLFLDEIADLSPSVQLRLLRVLENGEIYRLGGVKPIQINTRVISSTWKDLVSEVRKGNFRADLYYRLNLLNIELPPLRERLDDLELLCAKLFNKNSLMVLSQEELKILASYNWPGNIRELDALLKRYQLLINTASSRKELLQNLLNELRSTQGTLSVNKEPVSIQPVKEHNLKKRLAKIEREIIQSELESCGFQKPLTAQRLGISENTLWRKLKAIE